MLQELREMGITDEQVLKAMDKIPRHFFMDGAFLEYAYENKAFQIGAGQTISQPYTVAFQTQLLELEPGDKVLEIGTGSAYQTSVLCELGAKVYSIERQKLLFDKAKGILRKMGYTANTYYGDGYKGKPAFAPFDKILITCGAPNIPELLVDQLKVGGKMIVPLGAGNIQEMTELIKISDKEIGRRTHGKFSFVPMLEKREFRKNTL